MTEAEKPSLLLALDEGPQAAKTRDQMIDFARLKGAILHVLQIPPRIANGRGTGRQIAAAAREVGAGVVVLAGDGAGDVHALLHGSVNHETLTEADQPVLLLRSGSVNFLPRRILVATEGGDDERLVGAVRLVALPDTRVVVLHVPQVATGMDIPWVEPGDRAFETAEEVAAAFRRADIAAEAQVRWGPIAFTIVEIATAEGCDLIVLGSRPPSDLMALLVGSVSQQVIQRSDRPVLLAAKPIMKSHDLDRVLTREVG